MKQPTNGPVAISLRLYRALAGAFPYEFKNAWGDELVQVTEDAIEPIWQRHGVPGLVRLLADIAIRVAAEHLAELWQDVRYGVRMLAGSPGFTTVAILSLTLGIGVATSAFSEMNGFLLRDVPGVAKPGELVLLDSPASYPSYQRYRERRDLFSGTLAYAAPVPFGVSIGGHTERTWGHLVTPSYFSTLGVQPLLGRLFNRQEDRPGGAANVVISYRFWENHLGSDPAVIGKALGINGRPCTIIGVGPREFQGASPLSYGADLWLPVEPAAALSLAPELSGRALERYDRTIFHVVGRLRPGVAPARAEAALDAIARQVEREYGDPERNRPGRRVGLLPGGKLIPVRKQDLPMLTEFFVVLGGMVLLIACSNLINMTLARAAERRKEIAVRLALGASRARLMRQLMTESMIVAAGSGVLGYLMATGLMYLASREKLPWPMPLSLNLAPDARVLLFTLGLTVFSGLAFGLVPAWQATRADLTPALKEGGNVRLSRHRHVSLRNLLVVSQVAGSLALLLITGFLVIGHQKISGLEIGFDPARLHLLSLDPVRDGYSGERATDYFRKLLDRVKRLPSVSAASLADSVPMTMIGKPGLQFSVAGPGANGSKVIYGARRYTVGRDFFETIGVPILLGRGFRKEDETNGSTAIIVSEKLAQTCWKGEDPLGRRIRIGDEELPWFMFGPSGGPGYRRTGISEESQVFEVVGVARNVRDGLVMVAADAPSVIYAPLRPADFARPSLRGITLLVRAAPGVDAVAAVWREIASMDDHLTPYNTGSMPDQIDELLFPVKVALWTYGCIGIFGLILASVGLAGVTAYSVTQRRREIGIRVALGARAGNVLGLVMREGVAMVAVGTLIGLAAARAATRMLSAALSTIARTAGSSTSDPMLLVGAPLLLAALALAACYLPARQSLRIDPAVALRQE